MVFFLEITNIWHKSRDFWSAVFFLRFFKIIDWNGFSYGFLVGLNVLFTADKVSRLSPKTCDFHLCTSHIGFNCLFERTRSFHQKRKNISCSAEKKEHGLISRKETTLIDQQKRKSMDWSAEKKEHGLISKKERAWIDQQKRKSMDWSTDKK